MGDAASVCLTQLQFIRIITAVPWEDVMRPDRGFTRWIVGTLRAAARRAPMGRQRPHFGCLGEPSGTGGPSALGYPKADGGRWPNGREADLHRRSARAVMQAHHHGSL